MGGVRGHTAEDDIVFETILQDFEGLVRAEAIPYQHAWFIVSTPFSLGIEYKLKPLQADV